MNNNAVFPTILDCGKFELKINNTTLCPKRIVKNYELDYNISGNRTMILDGKEYRLEPHSVVFRYPGQVVQSSSNFDMYMLTLQLNGTKSPQKNIRMSATDEIQSTDNSDFFELLPPYFIPQHYSEIASDYIKIIKTFPIPEQQKMCQTTLEHMLYLLFADAISEKISNISTTTSSVEAAISYMQQNYQNSSLRLKDIANAVNMSESYLVRLFKSETGYTPKDFLNSIRLQQAKWHIRYSNNPIYIISYQCGFENPQYFISKFKAAFGKTPHVYRKSKNTNDIEE